MKAQIQPRIGIFILGLLFAASSYSADNPILEDLKRNAEQQCDAYSIPTSLCVAIYNSTIEAADGATSVDDFIDKTGASLDESVFKSPDTLGEFIFNSALIGSRIEKTPLSIAFKMIDVENDDSVLGIEFGYKKEFSKSYLRSSGTMRHYYNMNLNLSGVVTQNAEENPRNFIKATFGLVGGMHTKVPTQTFEIQNLANDLIKPENIDNEEMANQFNTLVDKITQPLRGFTFFKYGVDAGYEADQEFDAKNAISGAYIFAQYESWDKGSFLGNTGIIPSIRFSIDDVDPSSQTPRAMAGDDSSYSRVSGEISLWKPLNQLFATPAALTFNYRTYQELSPSDIVEAANLDKYHLRTVSLTGASGLFVSYSSGRLPFDLQDQQTVELGFKTYF